MIVAEAYHTKVWSELKRAVARLGVQKTAAVLRRRRGGDRAIEKRVAAAVKEHNAATEKLAESGTTSQADAVALGSTCSPSGSGSSRRQRACGRCACCGHTACRQGWAARSLLCGR